MRKHLLLRETFRTPLEIYGYPNFSIGVWLRHHLLLIGDIVTVETNPTAITELNAAWPLAIDPRCEGAAHIRNLKTVLQSTFPKFTGALTASHAVLNEITSQFGTDGKAFAPSAAVTLPYLPDATKNYALGVTDGDARYLSRSAQMGETDSPGISLFYSASSGGPWFVSGPWTGQVAKQSDLSTVATTASSGVNIGQAAQSTANTALSSAKSAQGTANSGLQQAQAAQTSANTAQSGVNALQTQKLDAIDGTATRLSVNYGNCVAAFQSTEIFGISKGSTLVFSVSPTSITWNSQEFVFADTNVLPAGRRFEAFSVSTTDGARVNFPNGFSSSDDIIVQLTAQRSNNRVVVASWDAVDSGGFTIGLQREDTNGATQQTSAWSVHVTAIGNK